MVYYHAHHMENISNRYSFNYIDYMVLFVVGIGCDVLPDMAVSLWDTHMHIGIFAFY